MLSTGRLGRKVVGVDLWRSIPNGIWPRIILPDVLKPSGKMDLSTVPADAFPEVFGTGVGDDTAVGAILIYKVWIAIDNQMYLSRHVRSRPDQSLNDILPPRKTIRNLSTCL